MTRLLFQAEGLPASYHCLKVPTGLLSFSRSLALEASGIGVAPRLALYKLVNSEYNTLYI